MPLSTESLEDALLGRKITGLDARELGEGAELAGITLDDGTRLSFNWCVGATHRHVGVRLGKERRTKIEE